MSFPALFLNQIQINVELEKNDSKNDLTTYLDCSVSTCSKVVYNGVEYLTNSHTDSGQVFSKNLITVYQGKLLFIDYVIKGGQFDQEEMQTINQILSTFKFTN